jgi:hypothetical protein
MTYCQKRRIKYLIVPSLMILGLISSVIISKVPIVNGTSGTQLKLETIVTAYVGKPKLTLYGFGPANAQINLTGIGVVDTTLSVDTGYFEFINVYFPEPTLDENGKYYYPEICLQGVDKVLGSSTQPTCIPPLEANQNYYYIGPVILSPTLLLEKGTLTKGEQIKAYGSTIPGTDVEVFLAREKTPGSIFNIVRDAFAYYIPSYQVRADSSGYYEFNIPADSPDTWKITTGDITSGSNSPLSNSLSFEIVPTYYTILWNILSFLSFFVKYLYYIVVVLMLFIIYVLLRHHYHMGTFTRTAKVKNINRGNN